MTRRLLAGAAVAVLIAGCHIGGHPHPVSTAEQVDYVSHITDLLIADRIEEAETCEVENLNVHNPDQRPIYRCKP